MICFLFILPELGEWLGWTAGVGADSRIRTFRGSRPYDTLAHDFGAGAGVVFYFPFLYRLSTRGGGGGGGGCPPFRAVPGVPLAPWPCEMLCGC